MSLHLPTVSQFLRHFGKSTIVELHLKVIQLPQRFSSSTDPHFQRQGHTQDRISPNIQD